MNLRHFNESDRSAWDDYVLNHPAGTFFHLTGWKDVVEKSFGHKAFYLLAEDSGRIVGVFPLFSVKSFLFGRAMVSIPFATYGGILADSQEISKTLYDEAVKLTSRESLHYLEMRSESAGFGELPTKDLYYVFRKEIASNNERNLEAIPRKTRRMVRMGMKNGLEAEFGSIDLLDRFYAMFAFNYRRLGTPVFSKKYLRNLLDVFGKRSSILIISKDEKPLSGVLSFYYKDQVIPYYSGAYPEAQDHAANDYLYWALMADSAKKGYRLFDFGRSKKDTGPYNFKRHWGFDPKPLEYQYYLNGTKELPNLSPSNRKYKRRIEMWKRLPLWATKIIGPRIVKYIP
jgi:FemAB-related protein (PEP-CTERM system-associated)